MVDEALPTLRSLRQVVCEVMAEGMRDFTSELKKELSHVRISFKEEIKVQMEVLKSEINKQVGAATSNIEEVAERIGEMERVVAVKEKWYIGVMDTIVQLLNNQKVLQEKITDSEGRSRRNNIQIIGIPENIEGSSMSRYVESIIMTELGDSVDLSNDRSLGIEREREPRVRSHRRVRLHVQQWCVS